MKSVLEFFNIQSDLDIILLVLCSIGFSIFLMLLMNYTFYIKNLLISLWEGGKTEIVEFGVKQSKGINEKILLEIYWKVKGVYQINILPFIVQPSFVEQQIVLFKAHIYRFIKPFLEESQRANWEANELKAKKIASNNQKIRSNEGVIRIYTNNSMKEIELQINGFWGRNNSRIKISRSEGSLLSESGPKKAERYYEFVIEQMVQNHKSLINKNKAQNSSKANKNEGLYNLPSFSKSICQVLENQLKAENKSILFLSKELKKLNQAPLISIKKPFLEHRNNIIYNKDN